MVTQGRKTNEGENRTDVWLAATKLILNWERKTQLMLILYYFHYWLPSSSLTLPSNYLTSEVSPLVSFMTGIYSIKKCRIHHVIMRWPVASLKFCVPGKLLISYCQGNIVQTIYTCLFKQPKGSISSLSGLSPRLKQLVKPQPGVSDDEWTPRPR